MAKLSTLTDNFDDNSIDITKWDMSNGATMTWAEQNHELEITTSLSADAASLYTLATNYDLTSSFGIVQLVDGGNMNLSSYRLYFQIEGGSSANIVAFKLNGGATKKIQAIHAIAGSETVVGVDAAYNINTHKWLRIRESGGTTFWETSVNGSSWTSFASEANPVTLTSVRATFVVSTGGTEGSTTTAKFDDFDLPVSASTSSPYMTLNTGYWGPH